MPDLTIGVDVLDLMYLHAMLSILSSLEVVLVLLSQVAKGIARDVTEGNRRP